METFRFESKDNRVLSVVALSVVFQKAGVFILNLGFSTCFEFLIRNLLLVIFCYNIQQQMRMNAAASAEFSVPIVFAFYYVIMKMAYVIGCFLFMATVQTATLDRPWLPTLFQGFNVIFWTLNVAYGFVTNFMLIFIWMLFVGGLAGSEFVNFLFLAVAKTTHINDMNLNYYERELVVNLLLMAYDLGTFYALYACHVYAVTVNTDLLVHPPK